MGIIVAFLVGFVLGAVALFFVGKNNIAKMNAAYVKAFNAETMAEAELARLKAAARKV